MPRITQSKINNVFSFSTGSWLNWSDEAPAPQQQQQEEEQETESEESQSMNSDHSSDFFHNFSPEIERMIIKTRANFLEKLEAEIEQDNLTFKLLGKCFFKCFACCSTVINSINLSITLSQSVGKQ